MDDGGDMAYERDTQVSLMRGHVYTQSKGSTPPEVHDEPPCHGGGSWGAGCCDA